LHVGVTEDFSENRESLKAARDLETTTREIQILLRGDHAQDGDLADRIGGLNRQARVQLEEAKRLANRDPEIALVDAIADGLKAYGDKWKERPADPRKTAAYDAGLAQFLETEVLGPCIKLGEYNTNQEAESDRQNQRIVATLKWVLLLVGLAAPVSGLLLGYAMARNFHKSIYQLSVRVRDAAGRLNRELGSVTLREKGDLPHLQRQVHGVIEEIERVVGQLQQREREMLHAEQLSALGQVAAGVAHELRNPLTSVKMLVQTGQEGGAGLAADDLAVIEHEVLRMESCIQTFLDFARPPRAERRRFDLSECIRRAVALVEGRARRQSVALDVRMPAEPLIVEIDPEQIQQVLLNLLLNALDALPSGGAINVLATRRPLSHIGNGTQVEAVEVCVQDDGPGISAAIRTRLFEPFVSSKETGLGLGLSICRRLVEAHGGTIRGENSGSAGAVFAFTLPLSDGQPPVESEREHADLASR
jgi:signal transduction histidine kinase